MPRPSQLHAVAAKTLLIQPHATDWLPLKYGRKGEFRTTPRGGAFPDMIPCPTPAVLWRPVASRLETIPVVLEEAWTEPLGAISEESLGREGYASLREFRARWVASRHAYFDATRKVCVWKVRLWGDGDGEAMGQRLLERLYGPYLP